MGLGAIGIGTAIALSTSVAFLDVTGVVLGVLGIAMGAFILPARKRKAKQELENKLAELRHKLVTSLTDQFDREMRRSAQRIEDTISPFSRFVKAENEKIGARRDHMEELEAHIVGLKAQVQA
jgi:ABC-type transport system involved in cytochrome bd biosynthesis fused ATPase/permease subunit